MGYIHIVLSHQEIILEICACLLSLYYYSFLLYSSVLISDIGDNPAKDAKLILQSIYVLF